MSNASPELGAAVDFAAIEVWDDIDSVDQLEFRWDFNGDGTWDTPWSSSQTASHTFRERARQADQIAAAIDAIAGRLKGPRMT